MLDEACCVQRGLAAWALPNWACEKLATLPVAQAARLLPVDPLK